MGLISGGCSRGRTKQGDGCWFWNHVGGDSAEPNGAWLILENWLEVRVCSERMPMAEDVVHLRMVGNTPLALVGV